MAYKEKEIKKIFNSICNLIEVKGYSLRKCLLMKDMPSSKTFFEWIDKDKDKEKVKQYARACDNRAERLADEILDISDATKDDIIEDEDGNKIVNHNVIQRDRLRTDNRKWLLGKLKPKKYGDSSLLKLANPDGDELKVNAIFTKDLLYVPTNDSTKEDI